MNNELAIAQPQSGIVDMITFSEERKNTIKNQICKGATDAEAEMFLAICQRRGLDPFAKQIHFVKYGSNSPAAFVVAIDALRLIANRTGCYAPGPKSQYEYDDTGKLISATSFVRKWVRDEWMELDEEAYYDEFVQLTQSGQPRDKWKTMPHVMLAKCAEARALRRAFPEDLCGLYSQEEMGQAENDPPEDRVQELPTKRTKVGNKPIIPVQEEPIEEAEVVETPLVFQSGKYDGKAVSDPGIPLKFLKSCISFWDKGNFIESNFRAEVEREIKAREAAEAEAAKTPLSKAVAEKAKPVSDPVGEALFEQPEPSVAPTTKASLNGLWATYTQAGFDSTEAFREERLRITNEWLADHDYPHPVASWNEIDKAHRAQMAFEIREGNLSFAAAMTLPEDDEAVEVEIVEDGTGS